MSALTPGELLRLLRVAQARTRDWCMILMAYRHGLRTTEICGLKLSDIKNRHIHVRRVKHSIESVQPLYRHPNEPSLNEVLALRAWLAVRPNDGSSFLFTSQKGGRLHRTQFFRMFQAIAKKAGLPPHKRHPRVLKYSLAAHLLKAKADVSLIHRIFGHRSLNSTRQYLKTANLKTPSSDRILPIVLPKDLSPEPQKHI